MPLLFTSEEESALKRRSHKELRDIDEAQWSIIFSCWRSNLDLWYPRLRALAPLSSTVTYPYMRHKHGNQITKPLINFGFNIKKPFQKFITLSNKWKIRLSHKIRRILGWPDNQTNLYIDPPLSG